jgi:hypothetical protein
MEHLSNAAVSSGENNVLYNEVCFQKRLNLLSHHQFRFVSHMILLDIKIHLHLHAITLIQNHNSKLCPKQTTSVFGSHSMCFYPKTSENILLACVHILLPSNYHLKERPMLNFDFKTHYELLKKFECDG